MNDDDPRLHAMRTEKDDWNPAKKTSFERCAVRQRQRRFQEDLGNNHPMTGWDSNGAAKPEIGVWTHWLNSVTDRVKDVIDIQFLSFIGDDKKRTDTRSKMLIWDLGQNVDRQVRWPRYM